MEEVYLLLGSNLGDREKYLADAAKIIGDKIAPVIISSSLYQTESWGKVDQPDFINQVLYLKTSLEPVELLKQILEIEIQLGRKRLEQWSSRTIDIDILLYGNQIMQKPDLIIPHPFMHMRRFTLMPLCEINEEINHPLFNETVQVLLSKLDDKLSVKKLT